jgi:hypothetical protein
MKTRSAFIFVLLVASWWAISGYAQTQAPPATASLNSATAVTASPVAPPIVLPPGTNVMAELSHSLNARKLKPGDKVKAVLAQDLIAHGRIVAKTNAKLVGHVTEVKARSPENPESQLGMVFDKILLKHHQELDFKGVVQALAPPAPRRSRVDEPDQMMPPPMLTPAASTPGSDSTRRGSSSSSSSGRAPSTATTLASSVTSLGSVTVVGSTPGSNPGDSVSTIRPSATDNKPISGGIGMHGVYGLKNLDLKLAKDKASPGPVIVSTKSDVKLESGTQVVVLVVGK